MATINRNFAGFGRELFTDTGQYVIRFDAAGQELAIPPGANAQVEGQSLIIPDRREGGLTLDQRAMVCLTIPTLLTLDTSNCRIKWVQCATSTDIQSILTISQDTQAAGRLYSVSRAHE